MTILWLDSIKLILGTLRLQSLKFDPPNVQFSLIMIAPQLNQIRASYVSSEKKRD